MKNEFKIGEDVLLNGKTYKIIGTIKRSFLLERDGKQYKATAAKMGKIQDQNARGVGVGNRKTTTTNHMQNRLNYSRDLKMPETEEDHMAWLSMLSNRLSPENLHCDGEISRTAAMRKYRALKAEWKEVEKNLGRKVSEDEVFNWERKKYNW